MDGNSHAYPGPWTHHLAPLPAPRSRPYYDTVQAKDPTLQEGAGRGLLPPYLLVVGVAPSPARTRQLLLKVLAPRSCW